VGDRTLVGMTTISRPPVRQALVSTRIRGGVGLYWALSYLPIHVYWALGGTSTPIGITGDEPSFRAANWGACVVILGAGLTCMSLTSPRGEVLPAGLRRGVAYLGGGFGLAHWLLYSVYCALRVAGLVGYPADADATEVQLRHFDYANLGYFELWFGVMGGLLIVCARRNKALEVLRGRPPRATAVDRIGSVLCLAGVAVTVYGVFRLDAWLFVAGGPVVLAAGLLVLANTHTRGGDR
jgi:hypothetical protein